MAGPRLQQDSHKLRVTGEVRAAGPVGVGGGVSAGRVGRAGLLGREAQSLSPFCKLSHCNLRKRDRRLRNGDILRDEGV